MTKFPQKHPNSSSSPTPLTLSIRHLLEYTIDPCLLIQPPSSYITAGEKIEIPLGCQELHHEIELGVVISKQCKRVSPDQAMDYVGGYCIALDMTARDFQVIICASHYLSPLNINLRTRLKPKAIPGRWPRCSTPAYQ